MQQATSERPPTTTCFVGNVAYGVTEEQLGELFREVGPVKSFRLVTDRDTGKPKGYGFCEFYDLPTSQSAQRNLNGHEVGGRALRVDFADDSTKPMPRSSADGGARAYDGARARGPAVRPKVAAVGMDAAVAAGQHLTAIVGGPPPAPGGGSDAISAALASKSRGELYAVLAQMQALVKDNPGQARAILVQNPQLTKALFQAQIMLGLVQLPPTANGGGAVEQPAVGHAMAPGQYPMAPQPQGQPQMAPQPQPLGSGPYPVQLPQPAPAYAPYAEQPAPQPLPAPTTLPPPMQLSAPMDPRAAPADLRGAPMPQHGGAQGGAPSGDPRMALGDPRGGPQHLQVPGQNPNPGIPYPGPGPYGEPAPGGYGQPQPQAGAPAQYGGQPGAPYPQQLPAQPQPGPAQPGIDSSQQQALLAQVMQLTAEQVASLPPAQRAQVEALQQHMVGAPRP